MKGQKLITLFLFLLPIGSHALPDIMRVGLFYEEKVGRVEFVAREGTYQVYLDGKPFRTLKEDEEVSVLHQEPGKLRIRSSEGRTKECRKVRIVSSAEEASFRLKRSSPYAVDRVYPGDLTVLARKESLRPINLVRMDRYLSGVVLAEAGSGHHQEFYKVQAVICRTYALHNLKKFRDRGFHLCDKVACQVYKGMNREEALIDSAVDATEGVVLVDEDIELITAAYHSNSGGRTAASEDAWSKALDYLRPIEDPFSKGGRHYRWTKIFPKKEWLNYLNETYGYPVDSTWYRQHATSYCPQGRRVHFNPLNDSIPLKKIRRDLGLRSTYFDIRCEGDSVTFRGKGFGHGVGVSQEGAMRMAELGVPYEEIINFYYQGVHLVKIEALDFFRE
jgi:stage II sporulation protein D